MSRLLDPKDKDGKFPFEYRDSTNTDVRKTWDLARRKQQADAAKVRPFNQQKRKA